MLDDLSAFGLSKQTTRPVWITIEVPRNAAAGAYTAKVQVTAPGLKAQELEIALEVIGLELPSPEQWSFHLDQWQHPAAVARVNKVKVWSEEHFRAMEPQMRMLAAAGQKVITATLNKDPGTFRPSILTKT